MCDMLKLCKDRDTVKLSYSARTSPDILSLAFHSNMNEARVLLRLSDVTVERLNVPPLEYGQTSTRSHSTTAVHQRYNCWLTDYGHGGGCVLTQSTPRR